MNYHTRLTLKFFFIHAWKYKFTGLVLFVSIILATALSRYIPILYKDFFDILANPGVVEDKIPLLLKIIIYVLLIDLVSWLFWRFATFFNSYFQTKTMADLAITCFKYLHLHSFAFFNNNFVGSLVKRTNRFYQAFEGLTDILVWELLPIFIDIIVITVVLSMRSLYLGGGIVIWIIFFCLINYFFSIYKLKYDIKRSELDSKVTGIMADSITNQSNIKLFCGYKRETDYFTAETGKLQKLRRFTWDLNNIAEAIQVLLMIGLEFATFYFALKLWQQAVITIGDFVLIQAYLLTIYQRFWNFGRIIRHTYERLADAEEMTEILDAPHEITDIKRAKELVVKKGKINFRDVNFNYHQTRQILEKLSLTIKSGEKVALVGPSGAGKTTIVKLLLRMYDLTSGAIEIDGQRISRVTQDSLHTNISMVPQDPILFHRSLLENIRYGKPEATDEEVFTAAKLAHCHEFISEFPEGYETYVGERGVKLSGGERQRVAIARAILRNAPILILDEATSSLDSESEKLIQNALDNLMKNKSVIVIAHRLSTIMKMDRIVVIDNGQIIEEGTHKQLLQKKAGLYKRLWTMQAGGFIE